jgi:hypothetical protein
MNGILKHDGSEWSVSQEDQDRAFPIHPEQKDEMHLFDTSNEYPVTYSLCYLVEFKLYCVKIAKSSFPVKPIPKIVVRDITKIEIIDGDEVFYIGENLVVEVAHVGDTMKVFISKQLT